MADNIILNLGTLDGSTIRTDDDGTAHWQYVKLAFGADNTQTIVGSISSNPLPVALSATDNAVLDTINTAVVATQAAVEGTLTVNAHAVTNAGTFATQVDGAALTSLQLLDNIVSVEDAVHGSGDSGVMALAVRNDALAALAGTDGDYAPVQVSALGGVWIHPSALSVGGSKLFSSVDLDESEEDVATGPCTVYSMYFWNATAAPLWAQIFNTNSVTVGTTAPTYNFPIPANADSDVAGVVIPIPDCGAAFSTALTVAITTGVGTDSGAPGTNDGGCIIAYQD